MRKLYLHKGREDLVTGCNVFVLLQDRWLWCHSSKWFMKLKNLILMSSKIYCMHQQGIDIQLAMAKYIVNTNIFTLHDSKVMLVLSTRRYLSAYYDGIIGSWLFLPSGKLLLLGSFIMRSSSSFEAQGKVNLPRAASHYYQAFFPALF